MSKHYGKVKSVLIPTDQLKEGMQVYVGESELNIIHKIYKDDCLLKSKGIVFGKGKDMWMKRCFISELKQLVVEYEENYKDYGCVDMGDSSTWSTNKSRKKQLPLKYSQWQSSLDNNEVDSDKEVEFEVIDIGKMKSEGKETPIVSFAKIIPQKKKFPNLIGHMDGSKAQYEFTPQDIIQMFNNPK